MSPAERVEVWQDPGGLWRWAWVREDEGSGAGRLELPASEPALTRDEALAAAQLAYPGVPVSDPPEGSHPGPAPDATSGRRRWPWLLATVGLSGALAVVVVRYRRWPLLPITPVVAAGVVSRLRRQQH